MRVVRNCRHRYVQHGRVLSSSARGLPERAVEDEDGEVSTQAFRAVVRARPRGGVLIPVPFTPDDVWGPKDRHLVGGSVGGRMLRGAVELTEGGWAVALGPMWQRDCGLQVDSEVDVVLKPEGPQRDDLAPDLVAALDASPAAGAFFDALAQFYRKAYLRWIDGTKRQPEERAKRIREVVKLLEDGVKERPRR
jgi:hypothetical protein